MKISTVVLVKNEEVNIEACLESVIFSDEIIVIDDFSHDKTPDIVAEFAKKQKKIKVKVIKRALKDDFAKARNFAMDQTENDWVFFVDADERVSAGLQDEIMNLEPVESAYYIKRRDFFWGRELRFGEIRKVRTKGLIRLIKKESGSWQGKVHEEFKTSKISGQLKNYIDHYPHKSVKDFINKVNYYSDLRSTELWQKKKSFSICEAVFLPFSKFILNYFIYLGFLDGPPGFVYAFLMSFHSFLVRAKLFQLSHEHEKN